MTVVAFEGLDKFADALDGFKRVLEGNARKAHIITGLELAQRMVKKINSDTGRLKGSIIVSHGKMGKGENHPSNQKKLKHTDDQRNMERVEAETLAGTGADDIYITTHVEYAVYVEHGNENPNYIPQHFMQKSITEVTNQMNKLMKSLAKNE